MKEEVEGIVKIYEKDPKNYDMKFICGDFPGMEWSREYYIKNIKYFLKNCEKDEGKTNDQSQTIDLIYYEQLSFITLVMVRRILVTGALKMESSHLMTYLTFI